LGLLERIAQSRTETRYSADQYITDYLLPTSFGYGGIQYQTGFPGLKQTLAGNRAAEIVNTLPGYAAALRGCPPAFAAQMVRALVLSQARFTFRNKAWTSTPRRLFGTSALSLLEQPWRNATTGELLARMEWHAGLAGNAFVARRPDRLRVLRPDWVAIVYGSDLEPEDPGHAIDGDIVGYIYWNQGPGGGYKPHTLLPSTVSHWSPLPDPESPGLGMSWITPAIRDIQGDRLASEHKIRYFENGAPQPLDARVLTPAGWAAMGDLRPGDRVIGADGKPHPVVATYPQGVRDIYRVTFTGGAATECTLDHLWSVATEYDRKKGTARTMSLSEILARGVRYPSGAAKWGVAPVAPVEFDDPGDLPIDPYLLGTLLGDGSFRSNGKGSGGVSLSAHRDDADEQQRLLTGILPPEVTMSRRDRGGWAEFYFKGPRHVERGHHGYIRAHGANPLTRAVRDLGLFDVPGHEKFIPERYLRGSVTQRVALLQGLIDTDGSIERRQPNEVRLDSTSERLARQLADLVGGLGASATVRPGRSAGPGVRRQWRVHIARLPEWINPCRLSRKASIYRSRSRSTARYIQSVEYVGRKPAQCISVDSEDHLYVTDDYLLTHNTPNLVVKGITAATEEQFNDIVKMLEQGHSGVANAYRTLYLTAGADASIVGSNLAELDLKGTQGGNETRVAFLSRVPAPILGIAEGLAGSSLNAGNFGMARRIFADSWVYPTLQDVSAALAPLVRVPSDAELWFDVADIPLLREDGKDAADIAQVKAAAIRQLTDGGFEPSAAVATIAPEWTSTLKHTGKLSVQLQEPGAEPAAGG